MNHLLDWSVMRSKIFVAVLLFVLVPYVHAEQLLPIKIGAIFILSGDGAEWGTNAQRGTMLAVEEINSSGGVRGRPLQVIYEDETAGSSVAAVKAFQKLVTVDRIKYLLGPSWQDAVMAVAPLARRSKVMMVGATYMPRPSENMFSVWMDAEVEADRIANHIIKRYQRVGILSSQQSWESIVAARFKQTFEALGGEIVSFFEPAPDATDVNSEVLRTRSASPEAVFISSYLLFSKYSKGLRRLGVGAPIFGQELDQSIVDTSGSAAEGVVFIRPAQPDRSFQEKYRKRFGAEVDIPAVQSYDAVYVLARALRGSGESYDALVKYFKDFPDYTGASGTFSIEDGRTVVDTELRMVRGGKIERFQGIG